MILTRDQAMKILESMVDNINLKRHMYAVEAVMRGYAKKFGEDEQMWGITGLLHDADWEKYPKEYPGVIVKKLTEIGVYPAITHAIESHGDNRADFPTNHFSRRASRLDHTLFAADELSGFVIACALVRPDRLNTLETKSVLKRMKDKAFARQVNREDIINGAKELNIPLEEHIGFVISCLRPIKSVFGF